nr:site-specific integrase [Limobrevibacterium gyesilva]
MSDASQRDKSLQRALQYRDGLVVALLAARPLRRRNLAGLRIGHSVVQRGGDWWLDIPASETKTKAHISVPLPAILSTAVDSYITVHRDFLIGQRGRWWQDPGAALWISSHGSPMTEMALYDRIVATTRARFGRGINPHFFRDCAATSIAHDDPGHIRMAAPLLGHRTFATTDRYYIQSSTRRATLWWQDHVIALRANFDEPTT